MSVSEAAQVFRVEVQELLDQLEQSLLDFAERPDDHELIDSAFRALHTIKGSGAMFGFAEVAAFTHGFESAFDQVRKGNSTATPELIEVALAAKDHIRALIERPDEADPAGAAAIIAALESAIGKSEHSEPATETLPQPEPSGAHRTWRIRFRLPRNALNMGTNPLLLLDELRALGVATVVAQTEGIPPLDALDPTECHLAWDVILSTAAPRSSIDEVFLFVSEDSEIVIDAVDPVEPKRLGEILVDRGDLETEAVDSALKRQQPIGQLLMEAGEISSGKLTAALAEQRHLRGEARANPGTDTVRVPAARLDELMDRVGELVIAQARLTQLAGATTDVNIKDIAEEIERLASGLRDTTMGIRMVPIGSLFSRFRRLVHDLSRDLGKEVELATFGEETELDKTMIERLADPLVHLIRNAIDHGLEDPQDRVTAGKTGAGQVKLTASHSGAEVLISIADNGRGLDRDRIRAKAEEQGLLAPGAQLSDPELYQFLFHPGFSTAREISAISGRGVGMDVVKRTIEALRGTIDIATKPGEGTDVTLRLPLTLAIIESLLVRVGGGRYAIPLSSVEECVELSAADDMRSKGRNFLNVRGDLVPFLRLRDLFGANSPAELHQKIVIVSFGDMRVGLVVDQVIGNHQTVIKSLSKLHADVETFSGATILGDGTVALILDIPHLVELGAAKEERAKAARREVA
jgi:two-component system chemotaxis sensor kinase CheA